jgi:hypothetical protein
MGQVTDVTLIDAERAVVVRAELVGDKVRIAPDALKDTTGWKLEPRGLCREEVCVPVRDRAALADESGVDLAAFARALGRPLALDVAERAAALGTGAWRRSKLPMSPCPTSPAACTRSRITAARRYC